MAPRSDRARRSLLAVFAHPDDESLACGGLLAACADAGARVSLLCLTRGEHGPGAGAGRGRLRTDELRAAARVLGVAHVEILDHEDGMLRWLDPDALDADIRGAIVRRRPDVVVTFDEDGLYWHPDHIAVHERTTAVVAALGPLAPALRYVSMPEGAMRQVSEAGGGGPILGVSDVDGFGASAPAPSFAFDAGPLGARKLAALRCHRSQVEGGPLDTIDVRHAGALLGTEHYRRATVGSRAPAFIDALGRPATAHA